MFRHRITWCFLFFFAALSGHAQHAPLYGQYHLNMMAVNPAYTGSRDALSVTGLFRKQWAGFPGAPTTQTLSGHSPLRNTLHNIGALLLHDQIGVSNQNLITLSYAYRMNVGDKSRLAFGLTGGVQIGQDKWSEVVTDSPDDQVFAADSPVYLDPRAGFGVWYDSEDFFLGFAAPQLIPYSPGAGRTEDPNFLQQNPLFLHGGVNIPLNPYFELRPVGQLKYLRGTPVQGDLNLYLVYKDKCTTGIGYRGGDGAIGILQFAANPQLTLGYAFEYPLSGMRGMQGGTHEIGIRYEFGYELRVSSPHHF